MTPQRHFEINWPNVKTKREISSNFVTFSENIKFKVAQDISTKSLSVHAQTHDMS